MPARGRYRQISVAIPMASRPTGQFPSGVIDQSGSLPRMATYTDRDCFRIAANWTHPQTFRVLHHRFPTLQVCRPPRSRTESPAVGTATEALGLAEQMTSEVSHRDWRARSDTSKGAGAETDSVNPSRACVRWNGSRSGFADLAPRRARQDSRSAGEIVNRPARAGRGSGVKSKSPIMESGFRNMYA
jgi:hypothetical protein